MTLSHKVAAIQTVLFPLKSYRLCLVAPLLRFKDRLYSLVI